MDCKRCAEDLTAYLDGELSPRRSAEIRAHLDVCNNCSKEMQDLADSVSFIESRTKEIPLKPEIWNNIRAQLSTLEGVQPSGFSQFWLWRWPKVTAAALAAASLIALGFWGYLNYEKSQESLRHYMNAYITVRDAQLYNQGPTLALAKADHNGGGGSPFYKVDNPFAESLSDKYHNPFRTEDE